MSRKELALCEIDMEDLLEKDHLTSQEQKDLEELKEWHKELVEKVRIESEPSVEEAEQPSVEEVDQPSVEPQLPEPPVEKAETPPPIIDMLSRLLDGQNKILERVESIEYRLQRLEIATVRRGRPTKEQQVVRAALKNQVPERITWENYLETNWAIDMYPMVLEYETQRLKEKCTNSWQSYFRRYINKFLTFEKYRFFHKSGARIYGHVGTNMWNLIPKSQFDRFVSCLFDGLEVMVHRVRQEVTGKNICKIMALPKHKANSTRV